jgi:hypothetical protein
MEDEFIVIFVYHSSDGKFYHRWAEWIRKYQLTEAIQAVGEMRVDQICGPTGGTRI